MSELKNKLHEEVLSAIKSRSRWEAKQVEFYKMRHNGRARSNREPWQSDLHFPLIDTNIEKLKPMLFQQIVGMDTVATFVPMRSQLASFTTTAERWFDYKIREKSNLQDEALAWIDYALMSGRGVMKVYWDMAKKAVQFDAIDPMYFIVPAHTKELQDADWMVHVMPMSKAAYQRKAAALGWKTGSSVMEKLLGAEDDEGDSGAQAAKAARNIREGITHDSKREKIIVWERYSRKEDGKWLVETYSPTAPDLALRDPMELIYENGKVQQAPFVDFAYEIKDKGWYSPRGIAELLAPFEAALCHTWNQKHDSMTLFNKPLFRAEREIPNTVNLRLKPGQILPYGVVPVAAPQPPMSFDQEMVNVRSIAEQRVANPDFGMGQVINTSNRRTATEIEAINNQTSQSGDLRARIFRMALAKAYRQAWHILVQFDKDDLQFRFLEDSQQVPVEALHDQYEIEPKGGVNEVNRQFLLQRAIQRKAIFAQSPWVDQAELDRSIMELDDPALVKRVFRDPNLKQQDQVDDEQKGIPSLLLGGQLSVKQGDDFVARLQVLLQYLQSVQQAGNPLPPQGAQAMVARINALLGAYEQVDTNGARKLRAEIERDLAASGLMPQPAPAQPTAA